MRESYARAGLDEQSAAADPVEQFARWLQDAVSAGLPEPNAMVLATASPGGVPSARTVLLKGLDSRGFVFYTNTGSQKGSELAANPRAALVFPWHALERQVRVSGPVSVASREETAAYFASRPRGSQLGAWASPQSTAIADREELDRLLGEVMDRWAEDEPVPVPDCWGGYRVAPEVVEFWAGRENRLHDRLRYTRSGNSWHRDRLAP